MNWTKYEIENIVKLLLSADEKNISLGIELIIHQGNVSPFIEVLSLIAELDEEYSIRLQVRDLLKTSEERERIEYWAEILTTTFSIHSPSKDQLYKALEKLETNIPLLEHYIKIKPVYSSLYDRIASTLVKKNDFIKAVEYYKRVVDLMPGKAIAHFNYAFHMHKVKADPDEVIYHYEQCIALELDERAIRSNLALHYIRKKNNIEKAIKLLKENIQLYPNFITNFIHLSSAYCDTNKFSEAKNILLQALVLEPDNHIGYNNLACLCWANLQEYKEALVYIKKALAIEPQNTIYWHTLAEVEWYGFQQKEKALEALKMSIKIDPNYTAALNMINEIKNFYTIKE